MKRDISIMFEDSKGSNYEIIRSLNFPEICPWCEARIAPVVINKTSIGFTHDDRDNFFSILFSCPSCKRHFLNQYDIYYNDPKNRVDYLFRTQDNPVKQGSFEYDEIINEICPEFKEIINQSRSAEGMQLNHLAGMGYRKATEFLVKDYLIKFKGQNEKEISQKFLGQCIKQLDDDQLKALSEATAWIGNDEAHYTRKHEDRNIQDLKKFLHAITSFISYQLSIKDAIDFTNRD